MTFDDWYQRYRALYCKALAPKTLESYDLLFRAYLSPVLGQIDLAEIRPDHCQEAVLAAALAGSRQAQLAYTHLHAVLRRAARSWLIDRNPCDALDRPTHCQQRGRAIDAADWELLLPAIRDDLGLALAAFAGLRRGEVLGLHWADVDLREDLLRISRSIVRIRGQGLIEQLPKSDSGIRCVPIGGELAAILRRDFCLTPGARCVPISPETLNRRWRCVQLEAGTQFQYRFHDLRHPYVKHKTKNYSIQFHVFSASAA